MAVQASATSQAEKGRKVEERLCTIFLVMDLHWEMWRSVML